MDLRGRLIDITKDLLSGEFRITIGVYQIPSGIDALREGILRISLKKWREKRSLTANAYYWTLVTKIADEINRSQIEVHNLLLRRYGTIEVLDGTVVTMMIPDTDEAEQKTLMAETYHVKPTSKTKIGTDGRTYRAYVMIKGSSDYDSKEMSRLISGTAQDAKEIGIEILPKEELERIMQAYEKHCANKRR